MTELLKSHILNGRTARRTVGVDWSGVQPSVMSLDLHVPVPEGTWVVKIHHRNEFPDPESVFFETLANGPSHIPVNISKAKKFVRCSLTAAEKK